MLDGCKKCWKDPKGGITSNKKWEKPPGETIGNSRSRKLNNLAVIIDYVCV